MALELAQGPQQRIRVLGIDGICCAASIQSISHPNQVSIILLQVHIRPLFNSSSHQMILKWLPRRDLVSRASHTLTTSTSHKLNTAYHIKRVSRTSHACTQQLMRHAPEMHTLVQGSWGWGPRGPEGGRAKDPSCASFVAYSIYLWLINILSIKTYTQLSFLIKF